MRDLAMVLGGVLLGSLITIFAIAIMRAGERGDRQLDEGPWGDWPNGPGPTP
jgi:hypothetical protein